jgi:hypothetical protein
MIISDEQVSRVCEYLHSGSAYSVTSHDSWTPPDKEFVDSVVAWICSLPDVREERVQEARRRMTHAMPHPDEVASKLIGRVLSDFVR